MAIGETRDLEATGAALETWLQARLPGARDLTVHGLRSPENGFSNETLLFDLESTSTGGRRERSSLVVRFRPRHQVFPEYDLGLQYRVMEQLAPHGIPVPRVRWLERDAAVLGAEFYVMDRIEGVIPPDHPTYHVAGCCAEMSPADRRELWWHGLETMARVHRLDWRAAGFGFLEPPAGQTPLQRDLAYYRSYLDWAADGAEHRIPRAALAWLERNQPAEGPVGLVWGDARIGNMIFQGPRCVGVLDWEMVSLGSPEEDLWWWIFLDWHHSEGYGIDRLEGLPGREETIERYEGLLGRRLPNHHYFEVFAAFRFAVVMVRVAALATLAGLPAPETLGTDNPCTRALARLLDLAPPGV